MEEMHATGALTREEREREREERKGTGRRDRRENDVH